VSPSTLVYVKGGYAGLRTEANEEFFALDGGGEEILDGYQVGVGIESALTEQVSLRVEATYVEAVEGITVDNTQTGQNTLTPHLLLGKAGLAWRW
jgi:opacity protein-like surface antigen